MKKNLADKPALFPMPVLMVATYDESDTVNVMNAAWGMISDMDKITLLFDQLQKAYCSIGTQVGKAWNAGAHLMKKK